MQNMEEYRLVMQYKNKQGKYINREIIATGDCKPPSNILELGLRHIQQIDILRGIQESILKSQAQFLKENISNCPKCGHKLRKNGVNQCTFNAVFTDHKVPVYRQICGKCKWSSVPSIASLFGTHMHPDLVKLQCEEATEQTYTRAQESLNRQSAKKRKVNSLMTVHGVVERVGNYISEHASEITQEIDKKSCKELIVQVDGGHLSSKENLIRSFEALTSVIYRPENVIKNESNMRGEITQKRCAASALDDEQAKIKELTLIEAKKEGLTVATDVTAICDGARNCWNIIEHLKPHCRSITYILDWFHIAMKFQNIGQCETEAMKQKLEHAKWCLWHGNTTLFYERIQELLNEVTGEQMCKKLKALRQYIINNQTKIVNYSQRQKSGQVFTSNNAECTVESLINQRCKGKQHMQWSRAGVHALLQIRAMVACNDWKDNWDKYVLGAYSKAA